MKKIFSYLDFLKETNNVKRLLYSSYDWDDNVVMMPTVIHMEHLVDGEWIPEDVSTEKFAIVRKEEDEWRMTPNSFDEFRDWGAYGGDTFLEDVKIAVKKRSFGPSWSHFIKDIVDGKIFAIITSRGHEPKNLRKGVEYIIYEYLNDEQKDEMLQNLMEYKEMFDENFDFLVDEYLDNCVFIGINSKWFMKTFNIDVWDRKMIEKYKEWGFEYFVKKLDEYGKQVGAKITVGFSDDDKAFADAVKNFMGELKLKYAMDYYVYYTTDPKNIKKIAVKTKKSNE
jgi:hypothetical protein